MRRKSKIKTIITEELQKGDRAQVVATVIVVILVVIMCIGIFKVSENGTNGKKVSMFREDVKVEAAK